MKKNRKRLRTVSAGIGLAAAAAMGTVGVLASQAPAGIQIWSEPGMTTGETVTQTTAGAAPETSVATPPFTFTTPEGFAVPH